MESHPQTARGAAVRHARVEPMDAQELQAALNLLVEQMEDESADGHEIFMRLTELLNGMRALGLPLPADLVEMEAEMAEEFAAPPSRDDTAG